jgi:uncharacterized membrane protein
MPKFKKHITVEAPVDIVFRAWHNFENFPRFMSNIEEVRCVNGGKSHWKAKLPNTPAQEWDAEMTLDEPNRAIGWRSIGGDYSGVANAGRVNFREHGGLTDIELTLDYEPPGGVVGQVVSKLLSNPEKRVEEDLMRFKEVIEKGVELSGLNYGTGADSLGGSIGANAAADLERIGEMNTGETSPEQVDDPARRRSA